MLDEIAEKEHSKQFDEDIKAEEEEYEGLRTYRINTQAPEVRKVYSKRITPNPSTRGATGI